MKIIITESQHKSLVGKLSPTLRRRLTVDDFDYIEKLIPRRALYTYAGITFETFMDEVIDSAIHDFVSERKGDEIETNMDPVYGEVYDGESFNKVYEMYLDLAPALIEMYRDKMYEIWKKYN